MGISGGETGITADLGSAILGSNPGRRTSDSEFPAPCRHCGGPTWKRDEEGAVHPCCMLWTAEIAACGVCPACRASEQLNREQRRRHGQKTR